MNDSFLYFLLGSVLAVALTYWGIWYSQKTTKRPKLLLINNNWLSLLTAFEDNFKTLKIESFPLPSNQNLFYYQGIIINVGNSDIDNSKMHKPLKMILAEDVFIKEFKLDKTNAEKIGLKAECNKNEINFSWLLMKPLECFKIDLILESPKPYTQSQFKKEIKLLNRIVDLKSIESINRPSTKKKSALFYYILQPILILIFLVPPTFLLAIGIKSFFVPKIEIKNENKLKNGISYEIHYYNKDSMIISSTNSKDTIPIGALDSITTSHTFVDIQKNNFGYVFVALLFLSIFFKPFLGTLKETSTERRLFRILRAIE